MRTAGFLLFLRVFYLAVSGIQPTPSSVLNASTSAVVSSSINGSATEVPDRSQSRSTTANVTPSTTKSLSNSSIEHVLASPSFSSHEPRRTSSSLPHERSSSSTETSRIATSSLSPVTGDPSSLSPVTGDPVSSIQSTPSLTLYSSMPAVVSSPIHISASEISGTFGTTINGSSEVSSSSGLTVSTQSVSSSYGSRNLKSYSYSVSAPSVSSSYGSASSLTPVTGDAVSSIQSTPSLTLYSSMSAVVSSPIHISASEISGSFGTTIIVSSEVSSPSIPMCKCPCGSGLTVSTQSVSSSYDSGSLTFYSYSVPGQNASSSYGSGNLTSYSYSVSSTNKTQNYTTSSYYTSSSVTSSVCYCPCGTSTSAVNAILCPTDMILNDTTGSFSSPFYPRNYPYNQNCSWKIIGKQGYRVELTIPDYGLEQCDVACSCDFLEVQNSFSDDSAAGKLCNTPRNRNLMFYSLQESLRVVFVSDNRSMDYPGFEATYKLLNYSPPICPRDAILLSGSGKISSTNYPKSNYTASRNCTWNITGPVEKRVKFVFTDFVLSACSTKACSDSCSYVELYDGGSTSSPLLGRYCQGSPWNESQFSTGNQMFVLFHPGQIVDRGFQAEYEANTTIPVVSPTPTPSVASNMYPYGPQQNDSEFGLDDSPYYYSDHCLKIKTDWIGIPFFSERHYKLYICRNGIIQLNYEWSWWWPRKFGIYWWFRNMGIIAPFWATTDSYFAFRYGNSKVYYQVYSQTKETSNEILDMASKHVQSYNKEFGDFKATWVLVVTWEKLCPYVYYPYYYYYRDINEQNFQLNCPRSNTFQAVLITDGFNAFLMYNYPPKGIQWLVDTEPEYYRYWTNYYGLPVAGWNAGDNGEHYINMNGSGTFGMSKLDKKEGNTGVVGRHFWRIENSDGKGAVEKCFSWARMNIDWDLLTWYNQLIKSDREMACPCTGWQAWFDWGRFRWSWWNSWPDWCFESRRSRFLFFYKNNIEPVGLWMRQQCCYSTEWEDWAALRQGPPDGGRVKVSFFYYWNNREETFYTDEEAFKSCCVDIPLCDLFYNYRPSHDCTGYRPPIRRWFWGDPHIKTLDGGNYTFNGIGEYTMVDARNGTFQLQARTKLAQGNSTTATIFSAGAAKEENTSTIEVKVKDGGGFHILIDRESYYGFNNLTNKTEEVGRNLSVSKTDKDCLQVSFPSTSSVQFCETKEMMSFVVTLGDNFKNATKGLLGTWNDDTEDDFTLPDGTVLPSSSSLRKIHFGFGVKWQINQSQSLFTYADNESVASFSDLDFEPMFADNITWRNDSIEQEAKAQCGDDHECLFDVASTNDLSVGLATKDISVQLVNESKQLNNFPPKIVNTSDEINATLHKIIELNITAEDDSAITFRVINKPVGATWNQTGNVLLFHWKVTSSQKINLTFVASDDQGASAIWSPTIRMCACQHDGQCVEPEEGDAENTNSKFVYLGCVCQGGYTGRFCDSDIDACKLNGEPCYAGVECTDLPPPANSSGYKCGPCPSGYTGDGAQCVDIDECKSDSPKQCEHKCINTPASFFCDCNDGFKLKDDRRNCEDINECLPTNDCMQKCKNSVGSYNCSCNEHFKNDPTDWRKCVASTQCSPDHGCSDVCYVGGERKEICTCYANFELESDGKTCKDINECDPAKELHRCSHICKNTAGSYYCSCEKGFELKKDGYECEDINECVDEDLYNCTDKYHKCVNTRGSYKCECERDTYFIDGKCRGLRENETAPTPPLSKPRNASEYEKQQAVQFSIQSGIEWDFERDKEFKKIMATVASGFCEKNRTICSLKDQRRKRRSLFDDLYTADEVNLLPGYPKNSSNSLQVAFYVQQPVGLYIGNISVLPRDTLVAIMIANKSDIEKAIEANISGIEALFKPTTTTESPTAGPAKSADDNWKWIVIGVVIGVVVILLLIGLLIFCLRKRKRDVKPITDPSQEDFAEQGGAEKEKSFGSGSQSA